MLALIALYMILASQFNSFAQPAIIMLSAPLSFVGAFVALKISGQEMTMFSQISLLALMGLVMKNGILLVDYTNQLRAAGASAFEAARKAGPVRLRPVLMTQIATICGLIPVAMSTSQGAEFRNSMGILVIGGLISSTLLTLVVVPVAYTLMEQARGGIGGLAGADPGLGARVRPGRAAASEIRRISANRTLTGDGDTGGTTAARGSSSDGESAVPRKPAGLSCAPSAPGP